MKRLLAFGIALFLFAPAARAESYLGLFSGIRIKNDSSGAGQNNLQAYGLSGGFIWDDWGLNFDVGQSVFETSGTTTLVKLTEREILIEGRRNLARGFWIPFVAAGMAEVLPVVETHFAGTVKTTNGETYQLLMLGLGVQSHLSERLNGGVEFRYLKDAGGVSKVTRFDHLLRLIYQF